MGVGFGYDSLFTLFGTPWDISWDFKYGLPFTTSKGHSDSKSFETGLDLFPGDWWLAAKLRYYSGFAQNLEDSDDDTFIDLTMVDMYFSMLWMATARGKFAPRSAYFLDRRQRESAGSWIVGGRLQYNGAEDNDGVLQYEDDKYQLLTIWGDVGYTYSWIFRNGYFWNLWGVVGVAYGREKAEDDNILLPEFDGKFAFGYIGENGPGILCSRRITPSCSTTSTRRRNSSQPLKSWWCAGSSFIFLAIFKALNPSTLTSRRNYV